jgi:hypothetical protein
MDTRERDEQIIRLLNEFIETRDQLSAAATDSSGLFAPASKTVQMKRFLDMLKGYSYNVFSLLPLMEEAHMQALSELIGSHLSEIRRQREGK